MPSGMRGAATGFWGLLLAGDGEGKTSWEPHHSRHPDNTTSVKGTNPAHKHPFCALFVEVKRNCDMVASIEKERTKIPSKILIVWFLLKTN